MVVLVCWLEGVGVADKLVLAVGVLLRDKEAVVVDDEVEVVLGVGVIVAVTVVRLVGVPDDELDALADCDREADGLSELLGDCVAEVPTEFDA